MIPLAGEIFYPHRPSFPRPSPQGTPEGLPYPILRRMSRTSQSQPTSASSFASGVAAPPATAPLLIPARQTRTQAPTAGYAAVQSTAEVSGWTRAPTARHASAQPNGLGYRSPFDAFNRSTADTCATNLRWRGNGGSWWCHVSGLDGCDHLTIASRSVIPCSIFRSRSASSARICFGEMYWTSVLSRARIVYAATATSYTVRYMAPWLETATQGLRPEASAAVPPARRHRRGG